MNALINPPHKKRKLFIAIICTQSQNHSKNVSIVRFALYNRIKFTITLTKYIHTQPDPQVNNITFIFVFVLLFHLAKLIRGEATRFIASVPEITSRIEWRRMQPNNFLSLSGFDNGRQLKGASKLSWHIKQSPKIITKKTMDQLLFFFLIKNIFCCRIHDKKR